MRNKILIALLATTLAGPLLAKEPNPARGLDSVNVPVVTRSDYAFDAAAPDSSLAVSRPGLTPGLAVSTLAMATTFISTAPMPMRPVPTWPAWPAVMACC